MQRLSPRPLVILAALALFAPSATATWYVYGSHEPDNGFDSESFMFVDPPGTTTNRIYFNVVTGMATGLRGGMLSPNVGLLQTHNEAPTLETHIAFFGVWADCNGDGYVGLAESAVREYPSELLPTLAVCPAFTGDQDVWTPGAHNYNGWVSELVMIGGISPAFVNDTQDQRVYRDDAAMVWGDANLFSTPNAGGGSCPIAPQPRGTWQSTGGTLNYVDCLTGAMDRWNDVWFGRELAGQNVPGLRDLGVPDLGLTFDNPNDARGTIYDHQTFGSEDSSGAAVYVVDCSDDAPPLFHSGDLANQTPIGPSVPAQAQNMSMRPLDPRTGSIGEPRFLPAQVNQTSEEVNGDCDTSNDAGHDFYGNTVFYVGEADVNTVVAANKRAANHNFQFQDWGRGSDLLGVNCLMDDEELVTEECDVTNPSPPVYGGNAGMNSPYLTTSNWNNGAMATKGGPRTVRADINEGTVEFDRGYILSWFAHVGTTTLSKGFVTPGGTGQYGSDQCGEHDSGIHSGWNCDVSLWYIDANGNPMPEPTPFARPGQVYQFRDVDCYDGGVGDSGIGLGLPFYGPDGCPPVSS